MTKNWIGLAAAFGSAWIGAGWFGGAAALAEPVVKETIGHYEVSGSTAEQVRNDLNRIGPFDHEGRQWDAVTRWYVNWRYRYKEVDGKCGISTAATEVKINIFMPRLKQDAPAPAELRHEFEAYLGNLLVHERGHGQFGIDAAKLIEEGLLKLPAEADCDRMGKVANEYGQAQVRESSAKDAEYDAATDHGATQGALFPRKLSEPTEKVTEVIEYYDVTGRTAAAIRAELDRLGPPDKDGRRFDGMTRWWVNWRYLYKKSEKECGIASATSDVKVTITLPRLKADDTLPAELRQEFETYATNLLTHQRGHGQIGIDIAKRIEDGIAKLPAEPNCETMGKAANEFGDALIKEANQQNTDYSVSTKYGATQGATFPK